ncbi:DUF4040 domain-containing protein [Halorutilales archaeon Cl-col2-1]
MMGVVGEVLLVFVIVAALSTVFLRDLLASIVAFSAYSLGLALLWLSLRAPDVALTEAAIGAGVMTALLLLTLAKTARPSTDGSTFDTVRWRGVIVVGLLGVALLSTVPAIPEVGDPNAPAYQNPDVTQYYLENAYEETEVRNVVTAVLAAYRGFDTFGEAVVVFSSGIAVLLAVKREVFT